MKQKSLIYGLLIVTCLILTGIVLWHVFRTSSQSPREISTISGNISSQERQALREDAPSHMKGKDQVVFREMAPDRLRCPTLTWSEPQAAQRSYENPSSGTPKILQGWEIQSLVSSDKQAFEECRLFYGDARQDDSSAYGRGLLWDWTVDQSVSGDSPKTTLYGYERGDEHILFEENRDCDEKTNIDRDDRVNLPWCDGYITYKLTIFIGKSDMN